MKTTQITLIVILYIGFLSIGYYVIEYANVNNIQLQNQNEYLSEMVERLIKENNSLKEEVISIREKSDLKYYYIFWTSVTGSIIFLFLYYLFLKHFTKR
jgi:cell division protein FtsB